MCRKPEKNSSGIRNKNTKEPIRVSPHFQLKVEQKSYFFPMIIHNLNDSYGYFLPET